MIKIKKRKIIKIGDSRGFIIPTAYHDDNMAGGLVLGDNYDLEIKRSEDDVEVSIKCDD